MVKNSIDLCIFCKIAQKQIETAAFWEDNEFIAILDINPNTPGMSLVITKNHYDSYAFDMPEDVYMRFMQASKHVAKILERGLQVKRVAMVMEGLGINHAHIKLYPLHGLKDTFIETWAPERVFFEKYTGYISTQLGPQAKLEELKKLAEKLKNI